MGGQHGNHNTTSVYRRIQVRGRPALTGIGSTGGPGGARARDSDNVLYRWRSEQQQVESQGRTRQAVRVEQDELTRLRRENETLRTERDCLKRAAAFFARESP